jgi:hypothetical protein
MSLALFTWYGISVTTIFARPLDGGFGANLQLPAAPGERIDDSGASENEPAGRKIRSRHHFQNLGKRRGGLLDQMNRGIDNFGEIVRWNVGGHAHGDARRAVHQQVRHTRRQYFRLHFAFVIVGAEIDGLFIDILQ